MVATRWSQNDLVATRSSNKKKQMAQWLLGLLKQLGGHKDQGLGPSY